MTGHWGLEGGLQSECEVMEIGFGPDGTWVITTQQEYEDYQALKPYPQSCIDNGTYEVWPDIDFETYDLLIIEETEAFGCQEHFESPEVEDCEGGRTLDIEFYWCGPCDATVWDLHSYQVLKTQLDTQINVSHQNQEDCP